LVTLINNFNLEEVVASPEVKKSYFSQKYSSTEGDANVPSTGILILPSLPDFSDKTDSFFSVSFSLDSGLCTITYPT